MKDDKRRLNIKLPEEIINFYKEKADNYSVPYTNYISMILTQFYEQEKQKELVKEFNSTMQTMTAMSDGSMSNESMMKELKELLQQAKELDN